jgi:hypothetical protein
MSDIKPEETFWDSMLKSAAQARSSPSWMKAGINLNERNFTTFRTGDKSAGEETLPTTNAPPSAR